MNTVSDWGSRFYQASRSNSIQDRPSATWPELSFGDAYRIQATHMERRKQDGETVAALKLGLTQVVDQEKWGVSAPTYGTLTDRMLLQEGEALSVSGGHAPRVEAEIVCVLNRNVTRPLRSLEDTMAVVASVHAGIEIVDSRFSAGSSSAADSIADNQSAFSGMWSRRGHLLESTSLAEETCDFFVSGKLVASGSGAKILGNPLTALKDAINEALAHDLEILSGLAVFTGNLLGSAINVSPGDHVVARFSSLGEVSLEVVG